MQETNEKGQNYADNSISMQIEAIIEDSHRPVQATKRIMELLEQDSVDELSKELIRQEIKKKRWEVNNLIVDFINK